MNETQLLAQAKKDGITKITTGVVALCTGQILIVRRNKDDFMGGLWELPGGEVNISTSEQIIPAALRELKEETNLVATKVISYLGSFDYKSSSGKKTRQFNYLIQVEPPADVKLTEHDAFEWCHPQQITQEVSEKVRAILGVASKFIPDN